jgi:hypothetical protein
MSEPNGLRGPWETLVEIQRQQIIHSVQQTDLIKRLVAMQEQNDDHRRTAVAEIKAHVTADVEKRDQWWRRTVIIGIAILAASTVLGVPLGQALEMLFKLKP